MVDGWTKGKTSRKSKQKKVQHNYGTEAKQKQGKNILFNYEYSEAHEKMNRCASKNWYKLNMVQNLVRSLEKKRNSNKQK